MASSATVVRHGIRLTATVSPALAARLARRAFFATAPRMQVRPADEPTQFVARRVPLRVGGKDAVGYHWGRGTQAVLLLHGWHGRASQFATLVRELVAEGFAVVSFDAPAHGASPGRRTDIRDWVDIAEQLHIRYGGFRAIVGHSFGALAALTAARSVTPTPAVVAIAGAASPAAFVAEFSRQLGLTPATRERMVALFHARMGETPASFAQRYDAVAHPLPAATELLVIHDRDDVRMPDADSLRLHTSHADRSRMLRTEGLGHTRVLGADPVLDAIVAFTTGGLAGVDALTREAERRAETT